MEYRAEDQLTRRERLRAERELEHAAPARIRVKLAGVVVIVIALLSWLAVSWFSSTAPAGAPTLPEPAPLQDAEQSGADSDAVSTPGSGAASGPAEGSTAPHSPGGSTPPGPKSAPGGVADGTQSAGPGAQETSLVVVHVGGAVAEPGVVELAAGARVHEAIEAAGGMTSKADPDGLNLAAPVQDGTLIWVPTPEELKTGTGAPTAGQDSSGPPGVTPGPGALPAPGAAPAPGAGTAPGAGELINLNTADATALQELPGIGPALSERIITYREANGPFGSLEELAGVSGIGPVILADVEGLVTW